MHTDDDLDSASEDDSDYDVENDKRTEEADVDSADDDANTQGGPTSPDPDDEDLGTDIKSTTDLENEGLRLIHGYESVKTPIHTLAVTRAASKSHHILILGTAYEQDKFNKRGFSHPDVFLSDLSVITDKHNKSFRALLISDNDGELNFLVATARHEQAIIKRSAMKHSAKVDYATWITYTGKPNIDCMGPKDLLLFGTSKRAICLSDTLLDCKNEEKQKRLQATTSRKKVIEDDDEDTVVPTTTTKTLPVAPTTKETPVAQPTVSRKRKSRVQLAAVSKALPPPASNGTRASAPTAKRSRQTTLNVQRSASTTSASATIPKHQAPTKNTLPITPTSKPPLSPPQPTTPFITMQMNFTSYEQFKFMMQKITTE